MLIAPETLIDGVMRTLREAVLPDVQSRFARGQLYAVLDILNNLRDRIEEKVTLFEDESSSAAPALERIAANLTAAGLEAEAAALQEAVAAVPQGPPAARAVALRAAFVVAIEVLGKFPQSELMEAHTALQEHLVAQAIRDVATLKPSLLNEISKG